MLQIAWKCNLIPTTEHPYFSIIYNNSELRLDNLNNAKYHFYRYMNAFVPNRCTKVKSADLLWKVFPTMKVTVYMITVFQLACLYSIFSSLEDCRWLQIWIWRHWCYPWPSSVAIMVHSFDWLIVQTHIPNLLSVYKPTHECHYVTPLSQS